MGNKEFTKQVIKDTAEREDALIIAKKIAKLFKGKSVKNSMLVLNKVEDIIKEKAIF
jgi:CO dehydrogenase nickel-insertion accessory protein CooC1